LVKSNRTPPIDCPGFCFHVLDGSTHRISPFVLFSHPSHFRILPGAKKQRRQKVTKQTKAMSSGGKHFPAENSSQIFTASPSAGRQR
jgi:hypothetical protein